MIGKAFERRLLAVAVLAIMMYAMAAQSAAALLVGITGVAFGWVVGRSRGSRSPLPMPVVLALITAVTSLALLRAALGEGFTVELFCEFIMMLLVVKMLDRRRARDDAQLLTLAVFLCIGAILTSNNIGVGLTILVIAPVLVSAVLRYQLVAAGEAAGREPQTPAGGRAARRDARRVVVLTTIAVFAGSTIMFLLFPRELGERAFGSWREVAGRSQTGFDDEIDLGSTGRISESATPVLDLQVLDRDGRSLGAPGRVFYLRGAVLNVYQRGRDGGRWKWIHDRQPDNSRSSFGKWDPVAARVDADPWEIEQRITMRESDANSGAIFAVNEPVFINFDQPTNWSRNTSTYTVTRNLAPGLFSDTQFSYAVRSLDRAASGIEGVSRAEDRSAVRGGPYPQEVIDLTRGILTEIGLDPDPSTRPVGEDGAVARAVESFLQSEGGYKYTLSPLPVRPGVDPTVDFLTLTRAGHCEYFASAMALMCRSVGVPARVVTGYVATEYNDITGRYVVRRSNAHAWVEVLVARDSEAERPVPGSANQLVELWRTHDPTPRNDFQNLHQKPNSWLWAQLKSTIEAIEFAWVSNVVGFSSNSQERAIGVSTIASWARLAESRVSARFSARDNTVFIRAAAVGGLVFGGVLALGWSASVLGTRIAQRGILGWRLPAWLAYRRRTGDGVHRVLVVPELNQAYQTTLEFIRRSPSPGVDSDPLARRLERALASAGEIPDAICAAARRLADAVYAAAYASATPGPGERHGLTRDARAVRGWTRSNR